MKINLIAPINNLGYGYTGLHLLDELMKLGYEVALFPIGQPNAHIRHESTIRKALQNADQFSPWPKTPCIRLWHQHDMSMFVGHGEHIGFPIFELDTFTEKEKWHLNSCDKLFVCSKWAKSIIEKNDITTPTRIVPLGVDSNIFVPTLSNRKPTIFFNCGKWEKRKGHDVLAKAFNLAFNEHDNVELWMMCQNPFLNEEQTRWWINRYKDSKMGHKIRILPRVETDEEVATIMQQADCGVFPSRAEGWNLEALEMLSCGKEVIATNYSAHTEFLTKDNAILLPIIDVEPAYDGIWFHEQGNWAYFNEDYKHLDSQMAILIKNMRYIHQRKQNGELRLNSEGIKTAQIYSWENTAKAAIEGLS